MILDLLVEKEGKEIGIDLIGHPGGFAPAIDLERYRMFRRAGLRILPLPFSTWQAGAERCLEAIEKFHDASRTTRSAQLAGSMGPWLRVVFGKRLIRFRTISTSSSLWTSWSRLQRFSRSSSLGSWMRKTDRLLECSMRARAGRTAFFIALLVLALALSACDSESTRGGEPTLALEPCHIAAPGLPLRLAAECGRWSVPEDRSRPEGRRIALRVALVRAVSRSPAPDPLVFLTGGPGQAATESYPALQPAFRRINRDRDVVLVDQRGTGGSNALRCPESGGLDPALFDESEVAPWVEKCLSALDGDPRFYTTAAAMDDLDEVREALGYQTVNLYGVSYGTRAALSYLRKYPSRVRAAVLDGVAPPNEALGLDVAKDAQRALDVMMARCASETPCREAFPHLKEDLDRLLLRLAGPVSVTIRHPRTGAITTVALARDMAAYAIRLLSYSQETQSLIPLVLAAAASGDYQPLAAQFLLTTAQVEETVAEGMGLSVVCSEDYPFFESSAIEDGSRDTYLGAMSTQSLARVCPLWPRGEIPEDFKKPVRSEAPVLLLSGEADPVTPPENAELVLAQLGGKALHLVAPGQGHVVIHRGCIADLAAEFIEAASYEGLDSSCVSRIEPQAFFVDFNGPTP
jgi:pimeloyl-ACP methyl ester carboxylesterase